MVNEGGTTAMLRRLPGAVSYTHLDVYKRQSLAHVSLNGEVGLMLGVEAALCYVRRIFKNLCYVLTLYNGLLNVEVWHRIVYLHGAGGKCLRSGHVVGENLKVLLYKLGSGAGVLYAVSGNKSHAVDVYKRQV